MYIPSLFRIDERETLFDFIDRYGFATLVSVDNGVPFATHLPLLLDRSNERLLGHVARANPHWQLFDTPGETLAIFNGPHAYISPTWYLTEPNVPTWNYTAVHVYGTPQLTTKECTSEIVDLLVAKYESSRTNPWPNQLPLDYRNKLIGAIVGFELPIARIEGKFKLGQNRSDEDRAAMREHLRSGDADACLLADFIDEQRFASQ